MKKIVHLFTILLSTFSFAQDYYLVHLQPKENVENSLNNPSSFLSERAIQRRQNRAVNLDQKDVPINPSYIQQIKNLDLNYVGASKWLNTVMIDTYSSEVITQLQNLPFVQSVESMVRNPNAGRNELQPKFSSTSLTDFNYGHAQNFIFQLELEALHQAGFSGQNMWIGVIDSGFPGVNNIPAFQHLYSSNRIVDTKNFVDDRSIYEMNSHGTMVLSTMAAVDTYSYTGTAPNASYALYVSEDASVETPKELMYWIQAAERADSIGVDIINTSLGYTTFDDSRYDFTYADMNGRTTLISKGAEIAASRGIFVVNAMGNDGNSSWYYLGAPADAPNVFSIGANTVSFSPADFTSFGPNSDNVYKPNVSAMGYMTALYRPEGQVSYASGTSFASPIMAGSVASLMSAYPNLSINDLKTKIEESAHLYPYYDEQLGYGVPSFRLIMESLKTNEIIESKAFIYPNPTSKVVKINSNQEVIKIELLDVLGKVIKKDQSTNEMNIEHLPSGMYWLKIHLKDGKIQTEKIIKK